MQQENPYSTPRANLETSPDSADAIATLNRIASGHRLMILAIVVSLFSYLVQSALSYFSTAAALGASVLAIVGVVRLTRALGRSVVISVIYAISMLLPILNLLIMFHLSSQAIDRLRSGGYKVGFFGAKAK